MKIKNKLKYDKVYDFLCVELLKKFTEKELEGLTYFVDCRYFNSDNYIIKLLNILKLHILNKNNFTHDLYCNVYEKVFAEKIVGADLNRAQKKRFNNKLNLLLRLTEEFLTIEALSNNPAYRSDLLHQKILEKRQFKLFNRHVNREKKRLETQSQKDIQHYQHQHKIEKNVLDYLYLSRQLNTQDNLSELIYNIDIEYLINKLSLHITLLYLDGVSAKNYDVSSMDAMTQLIHLPQYAVHPLIRIYLLAIDLTKTQSEAIYREFLSLLNTHTASTSKKDLNGFYVAATNFCAGKIQTGRFGYVELFDLYKIMDKKNLLTEDRFIPVNKLSNVIVVGCRVGEFDWAMQMIEKYQPFIRKSVRESVYHFNIGVIAFYKKEYPTALHHFIRVEHVNLNYDINARTMMMKAHYETDQEYDERTLQIFRSTEKYFNENQQLTPRNKKAYKNFIRTLINIYRVRHRATKMKLENIKEKLERQEVNSDKKWLLEKITELADKKTSR